MAKKKTSKWRKPARKKTVQTPPVNEIARLISLDDLKAIIHESIRKFPLSLVEGCDFADKRRLQSAKARLNFIDRKLRAFYKRPPKFKNISSPILTPEYHLGSVSEYAYTDKNILPSEIVPGFTWKWGGLFDNDKCWTLVPIPGAADVLPKPPASLVPRRTLGFEDMVERITNIFRSHSELFADLFNDVTQEVRSPETNGF
jgi:hypothetical protein